MKKNLSAIAIACAVVFTSVLNADIARVEMGTGIWNQEAKGKVSYRDGGADGQYTSNKDQNNNGYIWAFIKHPLPVIPNLRLEYASIKDSGLATGKFKDFDIGSASTKLSYNMKQYDIIPYYNILDNTFWLTLDLGLDVKIIDLSYDAAPSGLFAGYRDNFTFAIPLLYTRARTQIPSTNIGLEADLKYIITLDSSIYDIRAKVDYTLDSIRFVKPSFEIGYRVQKLDIDEKGADAKTNVEFSGFYAGAMVRF